MDIEICKVCAGTGSISNRDRFETTTENCKHCEGSGRVITSIVRITRPFSESNIRLIADLSEKVWETIRNTK